MKNNFKTYAKKSVSLFLAVLMVLSCWVWMAPEKAEAGTIDIKDNYEVEITFWIRYDQGATFNSGHMYYKSYGNGWEGPESGETYIINSFKSDLASDGSPFYRKGETEFTEKFTSKDFPTVFGITTHGGWHYDNGKTCRVEIRKIVINEKVVFTGWAGHNGVLNDTKTITNFNPQYIFVII